MPVPGAEALRRKVNEGLGSNACLYDAAGNPILLIGSAIPVAVTSGGSGGPLALYAISDYDVLSAVKYKGYLDASGNWYIEQDDDSNGRVRYVKGTTGYAAAWTGRAGLTYDYFDAVF